MQQYLVLCAGVEHEDEINPALLEFRSTRQQLEDGAFVFPACDFLKERLGRGVDQKGDSQPVAAAGSARAGRRGQPADAVTNPQQDLFPRDANDTWQVFLDHVRSGPIPNMCCRWHLNGKCVKSCFLSASHVALTTEQTTAVRAWIEQCRARMRRPSSDATPPSKKTKLGPSASAYFQPAFVAQPSQWAFDQERSTAEFHNRRHVGRPGLYRNLPPETVPREPTRTNLLAPPRRRRPHLSPARDDPSRNEVGPERYAPPSTRHRPTTPWRAHCRPETPTTRRHQPSQTRHARFPVSSHRWCHCRRSRSRTSTRRSHDSRTTPGRCPCHYFALRPTAHPRDGVSLRLDARRRPPQPRGAQTVRPRPDAALRAQPFSALTPGSEFRPTELLAPLLSAHPSGRVFRSASPKGRVPASRDLGF
ncbi:hypothetical protein MHU86_23401 [Fragilaria crotonensis]|nr:hypothetical protein MHU86_23401 [Fragilaria crotonensis]